MAKIRLTGATFSASAKTITHSSFSDITLAGILLITNSTDQIIIYNFADTSKGGTLATDTLTLEYDTTTMSDTDELMIFVDDATKNLSTSEKQDTLIAAVKPLSGASVNGTVALAVADTWYAVPSTAPTANYVLVASVENSAGTIRFGFSNTGTPSVTNGNLAPAHLEIKLSANQVIYFASSVAGDDCNWTTKII